jgi:diacylglycerol kinase
MNKEDRGLRMEHGGWTASKEAPPSFITEPQYSIFNSQRSILVSGDKQHLWRDKLRESLRGIKLGIRGHSRFFVHFFFAALVMATAIVLRCEPLEWCLLLGCVGMVLTAELFNSAFEVLCRGLDEISKVRTRHCLHIASGAVLLASVTCALIGAIVFLPKLAAMLIRLFT